MPSICNFEASILTLQPRARRLEEFRVQSSAHAETPNSGGQKVETSTCNCYIQSAPNQTFRVMVANTSKNDACISVFVDGEWIYSGLSYMPDHKTIYFSGRLIDESTIQEMKFVDLDTTCIVLSISYLWIDDAGDGMRAKDELGTIIIRIHRVRVIGPWTGKLSPLTPKQPKPLLVGEKSGEIDIAHRIGYFYSSSVLNNRFSPPSTIKTPVKPQTTEWIDSKDGPPYAEITFYYRSKGPLPPH